MTNKPSSILTPKRQKRHKFKDAPEFKTLIARHKTHRNSSASIHMQTNKHKIRNQILKDGTEIEEKHSRESSESNQLETHT